MELCILASTSYVGYFKFRNSVWPSASGNILLNHTRVKLLIDSYQSTEEACRDKLSLETGDLRRSSYTGFAL